MENGVSKHGEATPSKPVLKLDFSKAAALTAANAAKYHISKCELPGFTGNFEFYLGPSQKKTQNDKK